MTMPPPTEPKQWYMGTGKQTRTFFCKKIKVKNYLYCMLCEGKCMEIHLNKIFSVLYCNISMLNNELYFCNRHHLKIYFPDTDPTFYRNKHFFQCMISTHPPVEAYALADEISIVHNVVMRQSGSFGLSSCSLRIITNKNKKIKNVDKITIYFVLHLTSLG